MRNLSCVLVLVAGLFLVSSPARAQESDMTLVWQTAVNQARLDEGLPLYGSSTLLAAAAQRHADDLAAHKISSHTGSDGSTASQRVAEAGYSAWAWNGGELIVGENFWTGYGTVDDAMAFFLEDPAHRDNILSTTYREIGIGVATDADGRNYYVLDFSVRPNVLPIFVNDGAANADDPQVAIRLTNEEARPGGEGTNFIGQAIEIRVSDEPDFEGLAWQPWEPLIPWTLPDTPGEHTVYVQFRDAAGRTAASADSIFLGEGTAIPPTSVPPTPTPVPPSPTPELAVSPVPELTDTPVLAPTSTPEPSPAVEPTAVSYAPTPTFSAFQPTPFPTWTPLPTVAQPREASDPEAPLSVLVALQGVALILGIYLALRRHGSGEGS